jgi:hypothetical protein
MSIDAGTARNIAWDFLIGGALVAGALVVGALYSPMLAGVIAALPIRLVTTLALAGNQNGTPFVRQMLEGTILGWLVGGVFLFTYYVLLVRKVDWAQGMAIACVVMAASLLVLWKTQVRL